MIIAANMPNQRLACKKNRHGDELSRSYRLNRI